MTVTTAWTTPSTLDRTSGQNLPQTIWEESLGDLAWLRLRMPGQVSITQANSPYAVVADAALVLVDTSGGAVTVTMPSAATKDQVCLVKKTTTDLNTVTIKSSSGTVEGVAAATGYVIGANGRDGAAFVADGTNWWLVERPATQQALIPLSTDNTGSTTASGTQYFGSGAISTVEANVWLPLAVAVTITKLYVSCPTGGPGAGQTFTYTLRKNGADTAITCQISGTATSANDTAHSVSFNAGDTLDIKLVMSAAATNNAFHGGSVSS